MARDEVEVIIKEVKSLGQRLDCHTDKAHEHWERTASFMEEMRPILEAQRFIVYFQKFLKWIGATLLTFLATIWWLTHRSQ